MDDHLFSFSNQSNPLMTISFPSSCKLAPPSFTDCRYPNNSRPFPGFGSCSLTKPSSSLHEGTRAIDWIFFSPGLPTHHQSLPEPAVPLIHECIKYELAKAVEYGLALIQLNLLVLVRAMAENHICPASLTARPMSL